jgi:hypothetical protein
MRKTILGIAALAACGLSSAAYADDSKDWSLHGFGDISFRNDYVTPRGLVVTTNGATIQVLNGLVFVSPTGIAIHAGTWLDLNPGYSHAKNITGLNEFDWFVGIDAPLAKNLKGGVEVSQFISGQPSVAFKDETNIEFNLKYSDTPSGSISFNPYAKLFWAVSSKSSTVVLGKAGGTFDVELGAVPTYSGAGFTLSAPTWVTVGPKSYWISAANFGLVDSIVPGAKRSNLGVVSTGLKAATPLHFKGSATASVYGFAQYYHLINDGLVASKSILEAGEHKRDQVVFGAGIAFGF